MKAWILNYDNGTDITTPEEIDIITPSMVYFEACVPTKINHRMVIRLYQTKYYLKGKLVCDEIPIKGILFSKEDTDKYVLDERNYHIKDIIE